MNKIASKTTLRAVFELNDRFTQTITKIMANTDTAEGKFRSITSATKGFEDQLNGLRDGSNGIDTVNNSLLKTVSLTYAAKKGFDAIIAGIKMAGEMQIQENTMGAILGSSSAGSALYEYGRAFAEQSMLDFGSVSKGLVTASNYTRDMGEMDQVLKMMERLYAKDPTQGADGALFALKELLEGSTMSARNRFGMTGISGEKLRGITDFGEKLDYISQEMDRVGASEEVVAANADNILVRWSQFATNIQTDWADALTEATGASTDFVLALNEMREAGAFQPILNAAASAAYGLALGIGWVGENLDWLLPLVGTMAVGWMAYATASAVATFASKALELATVGVTLATTPMIFAVIAGAAALYLLSDAFGTAKDSAAAFGAQTMESLMAQAQKAITDSGTEIPVSIANTEPINVKGQVQIEDQSLKYLYDLAEERRARQYSGTTVYMQNSFGDVRETADVDELLEHMAWAVQNDLEAMPAGV